MSRIELPTLPTRNAQISSVAEVVARCTSLTVVKRLPIGFSCFLAISALIALAPGCSDEGDDSKAKGVAMGRCEDVFNACGGDPTGSWGITAVCVDGNLAEVLDQAFADYPSCKNSVRDAKIEMSAGVTYTSTTFERTGSVTISSKMAISAECFAEQTGGTQLSAATCGFYSQVLDSQAGILGQCSYDGTTCNCDTSNNASLNATGSYQIQGTRILEDSGNQVDFCVAEKQLGYHSVLLVTQNGTVRVSGTAIMSKNQ
ncbi:MAG TPA: hypothetical protein VKP30_03485 [Polyangiaceae bacterium]|nr:hypothetical protein [Polyangiaceae bacterium]